MGRASFAEAVLVKARPILTNQALFLQTPAEKLPTPQLFTKMSLNSLFFSYKVSFT
jgi:hypothetical protein